MPMHSKEWARPASRLMHQESRSRVRLDSPAGEMIAASGRPTEGAP